MKTLELKNTSFIYLANSFQQWLSIIGYSENTVHSWPVHLREFFYYLEQQGVKSIQHISPHRTAKFIAHVQNRRSPVTGTALSGHSVNKIINAINAFARYINLTEKHTLDILTKNLELPGAEQEILSVEEVKQLYEATYEPHRESSGAIGQRDRAIIAVFYGCGLRLNEGVNLNITDIDPHKSQLFVRKGKGNRQRYVPIAAKNLEDIKHYLEDGRNWFLHSHRYHNNSSPPGRKGGAHDEAFFINQYGQRMKSFYQRFAAWKEITGIAKDFSTHTFRHSIATHLLQSGMRIEDIAKFLGHRSLGSTQLYTHIINKNKHHEY